MEDKKEEIEQIQNSEMMVLLREMLEEVRQNREDYKRRDEENKRIMKENREDDKRRDEENKIIMKENQEESNRYLEKIRIEIKEECVRDIKMVTRDEDIALREQNNNKKDEKEYGRVDTMQYNMEIINENKNIKNDVLIRNNEKETLRKEDNIDNMINEVEGKKNEKEKGYSRIDTMQYNMEIINENKNMKNDVLIRNNKKETLSKRNNIDNMKNKVEDKQEHYKMGNMKDDIKIINEIENRKNGIIILNGKYNAENMKNEIEEYSGIENIKVDIEENKYLKKKYTRKHADKCQTINKHIMKKKLRLVHVQLFKRKNKKGCIKKKKKSTKICNFA